ncbi:MAG: hypothetical protein J6Y03_02470 [Alphaproteobacteria bacterium]|nr:hypothetical protein [Alphaproteobacteria bacterium]
MKKAFAIFFVMLFLQGCSYMTPTAPFKPSDGILFTYYEAPLTINFDKAKQVETKGEARTAHVSYYIFRFAIGDASLEEAMEDGLLKDALYADYSWLSILGIIGRLQVHTYGDRTFAEN